MGRAKSMWMEDLENEAFYDWLEENYPFDFLGEVEKDSAEWEEAAMEFQQYCEERERLAYEEHEQEQYSYYLYLTLKDVDEIFQREISNLNELLRQLPEESNNPTLFKMYYAHAVTILEVYLEDMVKALIMSNDGFVKNTIKNVSPFNDGKFKLADLPLFDEDGIKKFILGKLSENIFHAIPKAIAIIQGITETSIKVDIARVCKVVDTRHHIVHRNGKDKDGRIINIDCEIVSTAINDIEEFAGALRSSLEPY